MIQYRIMTFSSYNGTQWHFVIKKYRQVTFKRSKRLGWRWEGFMKTPDSPRFFATRAEALAAAKAVKQEFYK